MPAHKLHYRTEFQGLPISIENRKGSYRYWHDPHTGKDGKSMMYCAYGYCRLTEGADGDHIDVYIGPDKESRKVFVVHQNVPKTGRYDEDKCMLGFSSVKAAKKAYMKQYDDPKFFGSMDEFDIDTFKDKVHRKKGKIIKAVKHMLILKKGVDAAGPTENTQLREQDDASLIARARAVMKDKARYAGAKRGAKRLLKESRQSAEDMEEQVEELEILSLEKARKMPVGTISHGRKKVAEGKWVDVPKEKGVSLEKKVTQAKALGKKAFEAGKKLIPAHDPALMKLTEGLPVGGGATQIMEAWSSEWTKANLAAPIPADKSLEDIEPGLKLYNVELLKPSEFKKAIRGDSMMVFGKARGKKATVGTRAVHGGKKMVKTADGWKPVKGEGGKGSSEKGPKGSTTHKGIFYFKTYAGAQEWAKKNDWPVDRINEFGRGFAVQSGKSGNYAGPSEKPKEWQGTTKHPKKSNARGTPDQDTKGPKGRGAGPGGGKADGSGMKGAKDEARTSGIVMNWLIARKVGNVKQAKALKVAAKKAGGFKTDAALNAYLMKYGDPDAPGQYSVVMGKWDAHFSAAAKK